MVSSVAQNQPKRRVVVLPMLSLVYLLSSILIILSVATLIDRVLLPMYEDQGKIVGREWTADNTKLISLMYQRNLADRNNPIWRSKVFPVSESHPGKKRILVMGDSFVWGDGNSNFNDTWWRQLQLELSRRGYSDVEIIGAGLGGAATHTEIDWAEKLVKQYTPDMIIWGYVPNDPDEGSDKAGMGFVKQLNLPEDNTWKPISSAISHWFPNLAFQLDELRHKNMMKEMSGAEHGYAYTEWEMKLLEGQNFDAYKKTVARLADFAKESALPGFVVTLPMPVPAWTAKYDPVAKVFKDAGVRFENLLQAMVDWQKNKHEEYNATQLAVSPANGHPGLAATHFYATQVANILEKDYANNLGSKGAAPSSTNAYVVNDYIPPSLSVTEPKPGVFAMYYPVDEKKETLSMPMRHPFVQLNLANPAAIKEIHVIGKNMSGCTLAVRGQDPADIGNSAKVIQLGTKKGTGCIFKLPEAKWTGAVDEFMISADFDGPDHVVLLELVSQAEAGK